jgi:hypothetical protein
MMRTLFGTKPSERRYCSKASFSSGELSGDNGSILAIF